MSTPTESIIHPYRELLPVDWSDIKWETRMMQMTSLDCKISFGRSRHIILFSNRREWKIHRAAMNANRAPNRRRRSYWNRVAAKLLTRA